MPLLEASTQTCLTRKDHYAQTTDLERPYQDSCDRAEEIEDRIYEAKQELLYALATDHEACMELVAKMDEVETVLATIIGIVVRVARDKGKCPNSSSIAEMGCLLINSLLHPTITMLAEANA